MRRVTFAMLLLLTTSACSHIEIRPLTTQERIDESDPDKAAKLNGIRFYRPMPYMLVKQTDASGSCDVTVAYYRDPDQPYIVIPHYAIGSIVFSPTLTDGWNLTAFSGTVDTKVPEMITAISSLMTAAIKAAGAPGGAVVETSKASVLTLDKDGKKLAPGDSISPGLYKMTFATPPPAGRPCHARDLALRQQSSELMDNHPTEN